MDNNIISFTQALSTGDLIAVDAIASDVGFQWRVGMAKEVLAAVQRQAQGSLDEALWELLFAARLQAQETGRANSASTEVDVGAVVATRRGKGVVVRATLLVGVDESDKAPCIALLKPASLQKTPAP